ncbi:hypothetical protein ACFYUY_01670 [Kitasatospora sp. NPDC004745]|uniref:hypothetical protein n=1 Tax=Kitasatospora sp. NPDC004745 TaxID=3364019 RepID=UPI0036AF2BFD
MTRAEALAKAVEWAESAHRCYTRAHSAYRDSLARNNTRFDVDRLTRLSDTEYRGAEIEAAPANAWAAIAAATHEEPQP